MKYVSVSLPTGIAERLLEGAKEANMSIEQFMDVLIYTTKAMKPPIVNVYVDGVKHKARSVAGKETGILSVNLNSVDEHRPI